MARVGVVVRVEGDIAIVATRRGGLCSGCAESDRCGLEPETSRAPVEEITAQNLARARPGDDVSIELPGRSELGFAALVWALPIVGLLAGAGTSGAWLPAAFDPEVATLLGAVVGFLAGFVPAIVVDRVLRRRPPTPVVRSIVRPCPAAGPPSDDVRARS